MNLLPCPFCASAAELRGSGLVRMYGVRCTGCGATLRPFAREHEAVSAWNNRATAVTPIGRRLPARLWARAWQIYGRARDLEGVE